MEAKDYVDLINWDIEQKTEPPITMEFSRDEILKALEQPLKVPNHTQAIERTVPVLTESCKQKIGYTAHHRWILSVMASHKMVPKFNCKKHDP